MTRVPEAANRDGAAAGAGRAALTIDKWIDRQAHRVPEEFRPSLAARGPVSPETLLAAAEAEVADCAVESPRNARAALALLAADAYVTYACALATTEGADSRMLRSTAERVARGWWERLQR